MANLLSLKEVSSPMEMSGMGGKITSAIIATLKLSSYTSGFETIEEVFIIPSRYKPTVITDCNRS